LASSTGVEGEGEGEGEEEEERIEKKKKKVTVRLSVYPLPSLPYTETRGKERVLWNENNILWLTAPEIEEEKGRNFTFACKPSGGGHAKDFEPAEGLSGNQYPCFRAGTGRGVCAIYGYSRRVVVLDLEDDDEGDEEEEEEEEEEEAVEERR